MSYNGNGNGPGYGDGNPVPPDVLELYFDGLLDARERRAVEQRMAEDPVLAGQAAMQRRIDASLVRLFAPPPVPPTLPEPQVLGGSQPGAGGNGAGAAKPVPGPRWWASRKVLTLVLGTALLGASAWRVAEYVLARSLPGSARAAGRVPGNPVDAIYRAQLDRRWTPTMPLRPEDEQFAVEVFRAVGQGVTLEGLPRGVTCAGLAQASCISPGSILVLGKAGGEPVMLVVDRQDRELAPQQLTGPSQSPSLRLFRRLIGPLVVYEVTPLDRPRMLDAVRLRDVSPALCTQPSLVGH